MSQRLDKWKKMEEEIFKLKLEEQDKSRILNNLLRLRNQKINLMITGATGSGKSSTINALFDMEVATVGYGVDPLTQTITKYELDNLILWDTPGLGDGKEADIRHSKNIINKLHEKDENGNALIDLVLVVVDGSTRDMGTAYALINEVIIPNLPEKNRILVAINQCDIAMKGKGWNHNANKPETELAAFLKDKVESVQRRVKESTGVNIEPIYYSAVNYYNISKLLSFILRHTPEEKRAVYINNINKDPNPWESNDDLRDYNKEINETLTKAVLKGAAKGAAAGAAIGFELGGPVGAAIGGVVGGVVGGAASWVKSWF